MGRSLGCLAIAVAVIGWRPAVARACSCDVGVNATLPADGATGVPTNAKVWVDGTLQCLSDVASEWRVRDAEGVEVATTSSCLRSKNVYDNFLVLHPAQALQPNTTYTVGLGETTEFSFTTGAGPDHDPPALPIEVDRTVDHSGPDRLCSDSAQHWATLIVEGEAALFVLDAGGSADLDPAALAGDVVEMSVDKDLLLGGGACHGDNFPGGSSRRAETTIRYGAFDVAGNFSGWSEPSELSLGGCSLGGRPAPGWWLLVIPLCRRRRTRGS